MTHSFQTDSFRKLEAFVTNQRERAIVYPDAKNVFNAFRWTSFESTKVVILGQDPYHGAGQAHGLSFSVEKETKLPPSLKNIFLELAEDLKIQSPKSGNLSTWASQGVLLLNTVLTVRESEAHSHRKQGWETFTDEVIRKLNQHQKRIVFLLWGNPAKKKKELIDNPHHAILESAHPSPLSARRGFFGSRPFSKTNELLQLAGRKPINWETVNETVSENQ